MSKRQVETMIAIGSDRSIPLDAFAQSARALRDSGVVDYIHIWDQMQGWFPPPLWTPENAPLAAFFPDLDSFMDPYAASAYALAAAPGMGVTIGTDAIRRGPAEIQQTMMTLANMGQGRAVLQMGAGEIKQTLPFGWKRSEGLKRLEDQLRFHQAYWNAKDDEPVDMAGNCWTFDKAWIGKTRTHRPKIWALGGGPRLVEISTSYADGFATCAPVVASSPERFAVTVRKMKEVLEAKGRDPEQFDFCIWVNAMLHEDKEVISRALDNPINRWMAAVTGRLNMADWAADGIESVMPVDWHYANKYIPKNVNDLKEINDVIGRVTRRMAELSFVRGTPAEVASYLQGFIDAGANVVDMQDALAAVLEPADAAASLGRHLDLCRRIKEMNR